MKSIAENDDGNTVVCIHIILTIQAKKKQGFDRSMGFGLWASGFGLLVPLAMILLLNNS